MVVRKQPDKYGWPDILGVIVSAIERNNRNASGKEGEIVYIAEPLYSFGPSCAIISCLGRLKSRSRQKEKSKKTRGT